MQFDWRRKAQEWLDAAREFADALPPMVAEAKAQFREEPWGLLQLPIVRMALVLLAAIVSLAVLTAYASSASGGNADGREAEPMVATYRVSCTHPGCNYQWTITASPDYDDWPIACPQCGTQNGWRLVRCPHPVCGRRVVPRIESDGRRMCPVCGTHW